MNAKMKKGVSIREHVLNMINLMHEAEIHGATIDEYTQVSIILESLTLAFSRFPTNYVMNKLQYNMTQLLNELHTFEVISKTRPKRAKQMLLSISHLPLLVARIKRERKHKVGLEHNLRKEPKARERKRTPRTRNLKESVSIAGLKVTGRETVTSISPN